MFYIFLALCCTGCWWPITISNERLYELKSPACSLLLFICLVLLCVFLVLFYLSVPFVSVFYSFCITFLHVNPPPLPVPQDHPAQRHLAAERTQHILPSQRGRLCDVPQMEGQQGERQRIYRDYKVSGGENTQRHSNQSLLHSANSKLLVLPPHFKGNRCCRPKRMRSGTASKFPPPWTNTASALKSHPQTTAPTSYTTTTMTTRSWTKMRRKTMRTVAMMRMTLAQRTPDHASLWHHPPPPLTTSQSYPHTLKPPSRVKDRTLTPFLLLMDTLGTRLLVQRLLRAITECTLKPGSLTTQQQSYFGFFHVLFHFHYVIWVEVTRYTQIAGQM